MSIGFLLNRLLLRFNRQTEDIWQQLSAIAFTPDGNLWVASDEINYLEKLSPIAPGVYGHHRSIALADLIDLPEAEEEIDIEGMDFADGYLWLVGSHSSRRRKPKGKKLQKDLRRLTETRISQNRHTLARIPWVEGQLCRNAPHPTKADRTLTAACLQRTNMGNLLTEALKTDEHLGMFFTTPLPSKENGFDIEGLAVYGDRLFLGLRGPVLGGWAVILEISVKSTQSGLLTLVELDNDHLYKKHFLDLNGLGIRDLCWHNQDLLVLAGPTMSLFGSLQIFRWATALDQSTHSIISQGSDQFSMLFELPFSSTGDKAEGMVPIVCLEQSAVAIVYDSPSLSRQVSEDAVFADVFAIPQNASNEKS